MGLADIFKGKQYREEIERLNKELSSLKKKVDLNLTVQQLKPLELNDLIEQKEQEVEQISQKVKEQEEVLAKLEQRLNDANKKLEQAKKDLVATDDAIYFESYGLYKPRYSFANSSSYKDQLAKVRAQQKDMIRNEKAGEIFRPMTLDGSTSKGRSMQKKNIKQLLRAFNGECEAAINKVTKSNIATIEKRIDRSFEQLNKLNTPNGVEITKRYLLSKIDEAHIALEFELKKEEEREKLREQKEREREEKKLQQEIERERKKYEKDESHFLKVQKEVEEKISNSSNDDEINSLKAELLELQKQLDTIKEKKEKLTNRAENPTAGYVYIISNIGSFGKNVFKIGVTRRLDPLERIKELGSASVPFKFDVHALIFSEDAFKLESELHKKFAQERVNQVNPRKEYFNITIDDVKKVLENYRNLTFDFTEIPEAEEYRESLKLRQNNQ